MIQIDMPMPENCRMCPVCSEYDICLIPVDGKGFGEQNVSEFTEGRPKWCPLKEQEEQIKNRDESLEKAREEIKWLRGMMKEQEAVVRCMYCKRRGTYDCPVYVGGDGMYSEPDDWFCADGEKRTD